MSAGHGLDDCPACSETRAKPSSKAASATAEAARQYPNYLIAHAEPGKRRLDALMQRA